MTTQKHYREGKSKPHNTLDRYALRRGLTKSDTAEANVFDAEDSSLNGAVAILPDDVFTEESLLTSGHAEPTMKDLLAAISKLDDKISLKISKSEQNVIKEITEKFDSRFQEIEKSLEMAHSKIEDLETQNTVLKNKLESLAEEKDSMCQDCATNRKDILALKRHSREYNIRIYTIKEEKKENCRSKLIKFIKDNNLLPGSEAEISNEIEYVHRVGRRNTSSSGSGRQMIARFYSRETRNILVTAGKHKGENGANLVHEDFVKEDYEKRKIALPYMKRAHDQGKKTKFFRGQLIINGQATEVTALDPI